MTEIDFERASQTGRGRQAATPFAVPPRGWKDILVRTVQQVGEDRVPLVAAGVTYFLLLALFPTLTAVISVYGLLVDQATVQNHINSLAGFLPDGGAEIVAEQLSHFVDQGAPTLGTALLISLAIAIWSSSSGVKALIQAMNVAYGEGEKRGFFRLNMLALGYTLCGVVAALITVACVVAVPALVGMGSRGWGVEWLVPLGAYAVLAVLLLVVLAVLYRYGPSRHRAKWRWITPGAVIAVVLITTVSALFSWFTANFANYERTYGSLGGLIGFLTWVWICVTTVILGAELNAEMEHQTSRDSTVSPDAPLGQRGAQMADTVGSSTDGGFDADAAGCERSPEWLAGYAAARSKYNRRSSALPLAVSVPAALALNALRGPKRSRPQR
jgi:membrane protein